MNWDTLLKKQYKPPFVPLVKNDTDVSNFDPEFTEQPLDSMDPNSLSLTESVVEKFKNFTYDPKNKIDQE